MRKCIRLLSVINFLILIGRRNSAFSRLRLILRQAFDHRHQDFDYESDLGAGSARRVLPVSV